MFSTIATTNRGRPCWSRTRDSTRWVQISVAVLAVIGLLEPDVVGCPGQQVPHLFPHPGGVVGVDELPDRARPELLGGETEHVAQRAVDLQDGAVDVADTDADHRVGEHRLEPCLAVPPGLFGRGPRGERRRTDPFLLGQRPIPQRLRIPGGQRADDLGQPTGLPRGSRRAVDRARSRCGAARSTSVKCAATNAAPDLGGAGRVEPLGGHRIQQGASQHHQVGVQRAPAHRGVTGPGDCRGPRRRQPLRGRQPDPATRVVRSRPEPHTRQRGVVLTNLQVGVITELRAPPRDVHHARIDHRQVTEQRRDLAAGTEPHRVR